MMFTSRSRVSFFIKCCYGLCLLLGIGCFYFSISEGLFVWFFPDELAALSHFQALGLWGCAKHYYFNTTVNRISADVGVCLMSQGVTLFNTPFMGWVSVRLFFYTLIPLSMTYLLKELIQVPLKFGLSIAFLLSAVALFIISGDSIFYLFGLDLSIYATATITFFLLIALFPKSINSRYFFVCFSLAYALNLNSHEVFLVISVFFIPLFISYRHEKPYKISAILRDKKIWILSVIYLVSALVTLRAPGVVMRQSTWPSTGTFVDGVLYMILSLEEVIYLMLRAYVLVFFVFVLGMACRWFVVGKAFLKNKSLYVFLFCTPLFYLLITGYLIGITPSLWIGSIKTDSFRWMESLSENRFLFKHGGFAIRQNIFLYSSLFLDIFLAGFFIAKVRVEKCWAFGAGLCLLVSTLFVFHPDGMGSLRVLSMLLNNNFELMHDSFQGKKETSGRMMSFVNSSVASKVGNQLFSRTLLMNHEAAVINLAANHFLWSNRGKSVLPTLIDPVYQHMIPDYRMTRDDPWMHQIYDLYKVSPILSCVHFSKEADFLCLNIAGYSRQAEILANKKIQLQHDFIWSSHQGVEIKPIKKDCITVIDEPAQGEHFLVGLIKLPKGIYYFSFETKPMATDPELYVYMIGEHGSIFFPWVNMWQIYDEQGGLKPIFKQVEHVSGGKERLTLLIESTMDQTIQLRWQHGRAGTTIYQGNNTTQSQLCKIQVGKFLDVSGAG